MDELALQATGKTIGSRDPEVAQFVQARRAKKGEIWEEAKRQVMQERGAQATLGWVSSDLRPDAILTPEEATIREAKSELLVPGDISRELDSAAEKNPTAAASPRVVEAITSASMKVVQQVGGEIPAPVAERLSNPTNENMAWVSREIYKWQLEQDPTIQGYGAGGSMEERSIANDIAAQGQGANLLNPQERGMLIQGNQITNVNRGKSNSPLQAALQVPQQVRQSIEGQNPMLTEYYAWKKTHPGMEIADFLREKYKK